MSKLLSDIGGTLLRSPTRNTGLMSRRMEIMSDGDNVFHVNLLEVNSPSARTLVILGQCHTAHQIVFGCCNDVTVIEVSAHFDDHIKCADSDFAGNIA